MNGLFYLGGLMGFWGVVGKVLLSKVLGGGGGKKEKQQAPEMKGTDVGEAKESSTGSGFKGKAGEAAVSAVLSRAGKKKKSVSAPPDLIKGRGFRGGL